MQPQKVQGRLSSSHVTALDTHLVIEHVTLDTLQHQTLMPPHTIQSWSDS